MRKEVKGPWMLLQTRTQSVWINPKMVRLSALFEPFKYQTIINYTFINLKVGWHQFLNAEKHHEVLPQKL